MLGFADLWVELAIWLSLLITLVCAGYGTINWQRDESKVPPDATDAMATWLREEQQFNEEL